MNKIKNRYGKGLVPHVGAGPDFYFYILHKKTLEVEGLAFLFYYLILGLLLFTVSQVTIGLPVWVFWSACWNS